MNPYLLTTDIMEAQFGPVHAEVLSQTRRRREVAVKVRRTGQVLEYAVVSFDPAGAAAYPAIDRKIRRGSLMGQTFRDAGVPFLREENPPTKVRLSERLRELFGASEEHGLRIDATILVGLGRLCYARNHETYSPAIKWPGQVR
ncbi:MAG TPA: hypothetical protein VIF43_02250 [Patescibacteria group bacterium]|jgi:hypothetical protein